MGHPVIARFEAVAGLLDVQGDRSTLDDAITRLAAWMGLAADHLTEDDETVLIGIGALLYRDGLRRRLEGRL
ncbi:hypothetical protein [Pelomonas sp. Root1237]|uniref:hypothetical protein n=1 Tax=Pelomonas sp. Root1237 TaxID=1736434 RepID=UPI0006F2842F|nr:hypothetical protein [Pelomonas sp. Root1237]KQV96667.1 hypothetical protein ASC91_03775 [Pelomonas sp. Root1237]